MEQRLKLLYNECIKELKSIQFNIIDNPEIGTIDIKISKKATKRYGCCKQEKPDKKYFHTIKSKYGKKVIFDRFKIHHIEISEWVMQLDDKTIKNTIIHEILHCLPACNNHGVLFKGYARYINEKLGYNISRLGDKEADFRKNNIEYEDNTQSYKYKIQCKNCGIVIYRKRLKKELIRKYRCGKCGGKLELKE